MEIKTYSSLDEKKTFFQPLKERGKDYWTINTKSELDDFVELLSHQENNIYRGMKEAKYNMFTSLQRAYFTGEISSTTSSSDFIKNEIEQVKQCHDGFLPQYYRSMGIEETDFVYLSFLQHHRAPTPFLDFSRKLDVALYFATEDLVFGKGDEIDDYCSIYWFDYKQPQFCEFLDIVTWYAQQYEPAINMLVEFLERHHNEERLGEVNLSNLEIENYLKWSNPNNMGGGLCKMPLGLIINHEENSEIRYTAASIHRRLANLKSNAERGKLTQKGINLFMRNIQNCIFQNARLTNLNIAAQDGCFVLMNNNNPQNQQSLEDEFRANQYYPILYCANIHKSLGAYIIDKIKNGANKITKSTIYPNGDEMASLAFNQTRINNL